MEGLGKEKYKKEKENVNKCCISARYNKLQKIVPFFGFALANAHRTLATHRTTCIVRVCSFLRRKRESKKEKLYHEGCGTDQEKPYPLCLIIYYFFFAAKKNPSLRTG